MSEEIFNLRYANLRYADLRGAKLQPINNKNILIEDFMSVSGLGSQNRQTLIFKTNIGIVLQCGCFYGTEKEFKKKVEETHKDSQKHCINAKSVILQKINEVLNDE